MNTFTVPTNVLSLLEKYHVGDIQHATFGDFLRKRSVSFFDHLEGTARILADWGCEEYVSLAGLCHSIYGTEIFDFACAPLADRDYVRSVIGTDAERLVFLFCAMKVGTFEENVTGAAPDWRIIRRDTGQPERLDERTFTDILSLSAANILEINSKFVGHKHGHLNGVLNLMNGGRGSYTPALPPPPTAKELAARRSDARPDVFSRLLDAAARPPSPAAMDVLLGQAFEQLELMPLRRMSPEAYRDCLYLLRDDAFRATYERVVSEAGAHPVEMRVAALQLRFLQNQTLNLGELATRQLIIEENEAVFHALLTSVRRAARRGSAVSTADLVAALRHQTHGEHRLMLVNILAELPGADALAALREVITGEVEPALRERIEWILHGREANVNGALVTQPEEAFDAGDIIVRYNQYGIHQRADLRKAMWLRTGAVGDIDTVEVFRRGKRLSISVDRHRLPAFETIASIILPAAR